MNILNASMLLEHAATQAPEHTYIIDGEQHFTFHDIDKKAQRFAAVLSRSGVQPGDKIALLLPNSWWFPVCFNGALKCGAVPVPLSVKAPGPAIRYFLENAEAVVLVTTDAYLSAAVEGFQSTENCTQLLVANVPGENPDVAPGQPLEPLMEAAEDQFTPFPSQPEDAAVILYTSGTTGRPKGVVLTHFNYYFFANLFARDLCCLHDDDILLMVAPASHMFGQILLSMPCVAQATLSLMSEFNPKAFLQTIERDRVTFFAGVPALGNLLIHSPLLDQFDVSTLRLLMFGGATVHPELVEQLKNRFKVEVVVGYGLTEGVPITFVTAGMCVPAGSIGVATFGTTVRIVDEEGADVPRGESGEIVARGPHFFREYYNKPNETAKAWRGGWFHTGDIGCMDENGYIFILDRLNDLIKTSGYAVFPAEVERVLYTHPAVLEAAVVGSPHATLGEIVKAFVVLKPENRTSAAELISFCKEQLTAYKCPRKIEFRENLPKNPTGKILRRALRENQE